MQDIPGIENMYWTQSPPYGGWMGTAAHPYMRLTHLNTQQQLFSAMYQAFPYCCGAFLIGNVQTILPVDQGLKVLEGVLNQAGARLHLYIQAAGITMPIVAAMLEKFGRLITPFGNTYHQNHELRLWAISNNIPKILDNYEKGTFR